ncbi:MAG TPA: CdaR family protein [Verrucomicrobiae bacterium]|nr:CdaR family protein [Verrucomicrobiae bacterium]
MALRDWFIRDLGWKLFSLVLAVAIWSTVNNNLGETGGSTGPAIGDKETTYDDLLVLVVSAASDVRDFRVVPNVVTVTVSGAPNVMAVLQANQIRAVVDLTGIEAAKKLHRRVDISLPPGVKLVSVSPSSVEVIVPSPPEKKP